MSFERELANHINEYCTISYIQIYSFEIFEIQRISSFFSSLFIRIMTNTERTEMDESDPSFVIEGMRFTSELYDPKVVYSAMKYIARPDDIFIVTPPRSGTTWMQIIVYALLNNGRAYDDNINDYIARNPFLEMHGRQAVEDMPRPGVIKTHLLFDLIPYHRNAKYICVIRNPKDVCVSFHRFVTSIKGGSLSGITFDRLCDHFLAGKTCHADYFEYLLPYWRHKDDPNVLFVLYEEMKKDIRSVINRIATFLGIKINKKLLERTVMVSSFDYLKQTGYNENIVPAHTVASFKFIRKGIVGDWRTVFSNEQNHRFNQRFREKTRNIPELRTLWDEYNVFDEE